MAEIVDTIIVSKVVEDSDRANTAREDTDLEIRKRADGSLQIIGEIDGNAVDQNVDPYPRPYFLFWNPHTLNVLPIRNLAEVEPDYLVVYYVTEWVPEPEVE